MVPPGASSEILTPYCLTSSASDLLKASSAAFDAA